MSSSKTESSGVGIYDDHTRIRQTPGFRELRRPRNLFKWTLTFFEGWFLSRNYRQLLVGLPFLLVVVGGPMFYWGLKSAPRDGLVAAYEAAVEKSIRQNQPEKTGVYLQSLVGLQPLRKEYRHQLMMHYVDQEQLDKAALYLQQLVGSDGYVPTRIWLLRQAMESDPVFPLTQQAIDRQLIEILEKQPLNLIANWSLAERLTQKKQFKVAEDHLLRIVNRLPKLGLPLAKVQIELQRDRDQILAYLDMADGAYEQVLLLDNQDTQSRVRRAEIMLLKNDLAGARELISEGRVLKDSNALKIAESKLLATEAKRKLSRSSLNAHSAAEDLALAIQLNPKDSKLLGLAVSLDQLGIKWDAAQLQPAVDALIKQPELSGDDGEVLLAAFSMTGQNQKALEVVAQMGDTETFDRVTEAKLLIRAGKKEAADTLLKQLLAETEGKEDVSVCLNRVKVLLAMNRHVDAFELIQESQERFADENGKLSAEWHALFNAANFSMFQKRLNNDEFETAEQALRMLTDPRQGPVKLLFVGQRMLAVMNMRSDFEPTFRSSLVQIARHSRGGWQVYNMLGAYDLQKAKQEPKRLPDALKSLQLAYQSRKSDPMIMNNLALALVRNNQDLPEALKLANEAIGLLANPVDALSTRAEVLAAQGKWEEALRDLEAALAEKPNSLNVRRLLVKVLTELEQPSLAEEHQIVYEQLSASQTKTDRANSE